MKLHLCGDLSPTAFAILSHALDRARDDDEDIEAIDEIEATVQESATQPVAPAKTGIKVVRGGQSWHGGEHAWSLPTQRADGTWEPGAWTPPVTPHLCSTGYHLTRDPAQWWGEGDVVAYLAEYDGAVDDRGDEKFAVERCRLLRPLEAAELAAAGPARGPEGGVAVAAQGVRPCARVTRGGLDRPRAGGASGAAE